MVHALELCPLDNAVNGLLEDLRGVLRLLVRQERLNVLVDVVRNDLRDLVMYDRVEYVHRDRPQSLGLQALPLPALDEVLAQLDVLIEVQTVVELHASVVFRTHARGCDRLSIRQHTDPPDRVPSRSS